MNTNTDQSIVVKLEQVTRVYQQDSQAVRALDGIDLEIRSGDFAVLVGPSGSGKTTLLNLIGGLDSPTSGRIWVAGTETGRMSTALTENAPTARPTAAFDPASSLST